MRIGSDKRGFVLIVSTILLLSVTVIAAGFVFLVSARSRAAAALLDGAKALALAEAGVQQVIYRVTTDAAYAAAPTAVTGALGSGAYTASVTKQAGQPIYTIASSGTAGGVSRNVVQTATCDMQGWGAAFADYGAFARNGIDMQSQTRISGDAYSAAGSVTTSSQASVTGTVYADSGSGNYDRLPLPVPPVPVPALATSYYTSLVDTARTYPVKNMAYGTLALGGGTVYVNGRVTVQHITGPGTIVTTGRITVNGGTVGRDVTIVSDNTASFKTGSHVQSGAVIYATTSIHLVEKDVVMDSAVLVTPGVVTNTTNRVTINGAIFCGGDLTLAKTTVVTGGVVSGGTIKMVQSAQIVQSRNHLPPSVPPGIPRDILVTLSGWQEV